MKMFTYVYGKKLIKLKITFNFDENYHDRD